MKKRCSKKYFCLILQSENNMEISQNSYIIIDDTQFEYTSNEPYTILQFCHKIGIDIPCFCITKN